MSRRERAGSLLRSFQAAFAGLSHLLLTQRNARIHLGITIAILALGLWLRLEATEWALLVLAMGLVWSAESINTALEALVDLASPEMQPTARAAKDVAAAAVLLSAAAALLVGVLMLGPVLLLKLGWL